MKEYLSIEIARFIGRVGLLTEEVLRWWHKHAIEIEAENDRLRGQCHQADLRAAELEAEVAIKETAFQLACTRISDSCGDFTSNWKRKFLMQAREAGDDEPNDHH